MSRTYDDDMERWMALGARLRKLDPGRFERVLALARAYIAIYEDPELSNSVLYAMFAEVRGRGPNGGPS